MFSALLALLSTLLHTARSCADLLAENAALRQARTRPRIPSQHTEFIRRISADHPEWGEDRIALELSG